MKIAIDARFYGTENGGLGRYTLNLIKELSKQASTDTYILLLNKKYAGKLDLPSNFIQVALSSRHYSFYEQLEVPYVLYKLKVDLVHFLHFNAPILYRKKYLVTIHDLLMHSGVGMSATTRSPIIYMIKRLAYRLVFDNSVKSAAHIFVPTEYIKKEIRKIYDLPSSKVSVTYEGVDSAITKSNSRRFLDTINVNRPYFFYVGNAYPHKNLSFLIEAIVHLNKVANSHLIIVTPKNIFAQRLKKTIELLDAKMYVTVLENISDQDLSELYTYADSFVFPSLSEGFGLPVLEAFSVSTLALASDIPVFREVYGTAALYFDPTDVDSLVTQMKKILSLPSETKIKMKKRALDHASRYSWQKMAETVVTKYNAFK
jgi:glycosyltransferase involved in cell wall biosynthesis